AHEPRPEVSDFLRGHAADLDRGVGPVAPDEARERTVSRSIEPQRWRRSPAVVATGARRRPALAAAAVAALLIGSVAGFAAGRSSAPSTHSVAARSASQDTTTPTVIPSARATGAGGPF